jgi:hypothetical protein
MPEALAVAFVFAATVAAFVAAKLLTMNPSAETQRDDVNRLHHQRLWLEERLEAARREGWDEEMQRHISQELAVTCAQLESNQRRA